MSAVVLLSGGLDSTVALAETIETTGVALALTFDYGQRAARMELAASQAIARHYNLRHQVIQLNWLAELLPQGLDASASGAISGVGDITLDQVWVPNRNGVFLNIAAAWAEAMSAKYVVFGANAEEGAEFPDNTEEYRERLNQALTYSTRNRVQVQAPVAHLDKIGIIKRGQALNIPWPHIWSCYGAGPMHCGQCASCRLLKQAMNDYPIETRPSLTFSS